MLTWTRGFPCSSIFEMLSKRLTLKSDVGSWSICCNPCYACHLSREAGMSAPSHFCNPHSSLSTQNKLSGTCYRLVRMSSHVHYRLAAFTASISRENNCWTSLLMGACRSNGRDKIHLGKLGCLGIYLISYVLYSTEMSETIVLVFCSTVLILLHCAYQYCQYWLQLFMQVCCI